MEPSLDDMRERFRRAVPMLSQPIDFDDLIARGILSKAGRGWYVIHKWDELPKAAEARIEYIATGWRVKFNTKR